MPNQKDVREPDKEEDAAGFTTGASSIIEALGVTPPDPIAVLGFISTRLSTIEATALFMGYALTARAAGLEKINCFHNRQDNVIAVYIKESELEAYEKQCLIQNQQKQKDSTTQSSG